MKKLFPFALLFVLAFAGWFAGDSVAQGTGVPFPSVGANPNNQVCGQPRAAYYVGTLYTCQAGKMAKASGSSSGTMGTVIISGTSGQIAVSGTCNSSTTINCVVGFVAAPVMPSATTGTTQSAADNSTKLATTAYADAAAAGKQSSTLTNTHILVGNVSNVATDVALSGDGTMANTGAITISNGSHITNSSIPNSGLVNTATTVNGQTCTLGSTCTVPFQTNSVSNTSQSGINLLTSTANASGLTLTPINSGTNQEKLEISGTVLNSKGGTGADSSASTGVAQLSSGTWSFSTALANGTTATTQSASDNSTKVATTAYVDRAAPAALHSVTFVIQGASGAAIATGDLGLFPTADFACTINRTDISADQSGSITVDIWKRAGAIPAGAQKISASAPVTLSSAQLNQNGSISGWSTTVSSGDVFGATVATASTVTKVTVQIWCQ